MWILGIIGLLIIVVLGALAFLLLSPSGGSKTSDVVEVDSLDQVPTNNSSMLVLVGGILLLGVGAVIVILAASATIFKPVEGAEFFDKNTWPETTATITSVRRRSTGDNDTEWRAYYSFNVEGVGYTGSDRVYSRNRYDIGETITVNYWPNSPGLFNDVDRSSTGLLELPPGAALIIGVVFAGLSLALGGGTLMKRD